MAVRYGKVYKYDKVRSKFQPKEQHDGKARFKNCVSAQRARYIGTDG